MNSTDSRIRQLIVTPIAFSDPPLLNSSGVHEPLALRCVLQLVLEDGTVGLGETPAATTGSNVCWPPGR